MLVKKSVSIATASMLTLSVASVSVWATNDAPVKDVLDQQEALQKISKDTGSQFSVAWDSETKAPSFVRGKISNKKLKTKEDALAILEENKALYQIKQASSDLTLDKQGSDQFGSFYKFQQVYKGIPVFGHQLVVHGDQKQISNSVSGTFDAQVFSKEIDTKAKLTEAEATKKAKVANGLGEVKMFDIQKADLYIYGASTGKHTLVYRVTLSTLEKSELFYADIFIDAQTGAVVDQIDKVHRAAAVGKGKGVLNDNKSINTDSYSGGYYLRDITKPMYSQNGGVIETYTAKNQMVSPGTLLTDSDNTWVDPAAVDAHVYAGKVYDYYYTKLGRNSFDGEGGTLKSTVHYRENYGNAGWTGTQMVYGDGDGGDRYAYLSGALDVVAHEITHGVTERTADLVYEGQSGALNESWSDVFGNLIENKSDPEWLCGEDIITPNIPGDALRSMSDPNKYGDPDHMRDYVNTTEDHGGVHTNSGIPNKAFYLFVTTSGVTRDNAAKVWYRALSQYLTSNSKFIDARNATIQSATDLFGAGSKEVSAVTNAWNKVGVGGNSPDNPNQPSSDPYESNDTRATAYKISSGTTYNGKITSSADEDWFQLTKSTSGTISLRLTNLPEDYDLYLYDASGRLLTYSEEGGKTSELISYWGSARATYYIKVVGYDGKNSSTAYSLKATY
ncbi:M4 family metallopeptidase [Thermoactinomyces sp. DSM 45892]|uniref:M4 family metallopeptidase n=1 Tax=Thermoactinomyces sp. DSM 45892 TaxID=1882753 RepID=UPI0008963D02|nr:M4 family metallopeptidase [Thermoactinomyces sp. DSM 45892]SDY67519.1 bacillolysin/thermolysin [Thermoactinomyces sp. DSM 45892]